MKYLLSTGELTTRFDLYILDLVKMYTTIYPGDIPGALDYGFDFLFTNVMEKDLEQAVIERVQNLISKIQNRFNSRGLKIVLVSVNLINTKKAKVVLNINNEEVGPIEVNLLN